VELGGDDRARARELIHDLRNALGLVINYSTLMTNELADRPEVLEDLAEVGAAGRRAAELVRDLSDLIGSAEN
jgi:signal transduction histidine kinase